MPPWADVHVGTSGWSYPHWRGTLYAPDLPASRWLDAYALAFRTVEVNYSFYRLPSRRVFAGWAQRVPDGSLFAVKASRYITHVRRLRDCAEPLVRLLDSASALGDRLGPILFQLPPNLPKDLDLLDDFVDLLPRDRRFAFEFRDPDWLDGQVADLLVDRGCALCAAASGGPPTLWPDSQPFRYVRMHAGTSGVSFGDAEIDALALKLARDCRAGREAFVFFNNDVGGHAVTDARRLLARLDAIEPRRQLAA